MFTCKTDASHFSFQWLQPEWDGIAGNILSIYGGLSFNPTLGPLWFWHRQKFASVGHSNQQKMLKLTVRYSRVLPVDRGLNLESVHAKGDLLLMLLLCKTENIPISPWVWCNNNQIYLLAWKEEIVFVDYTLSVSTNNCMLITRGNMNSMFFFQWRRLSLLSDKLMFFFSTAA